jgi:hypothetical protein
VRRADNLTTFMCRLSGNLGAPTSWNPKGLSRPIMGLLYLYLYLQVRDPYPLLCRPLFVARFLHRVVCIVGNTSPLGTYFTESRFISVLLYMIFIYQYTIKQPLHTYFSFRHGDLPHTHIMHVTHQNQSQIFYLYFKPCTVLTFNILCLYLGCNTCLIRRCTYPL